MFRISPLHHFGGCRKVMKYKIFIYCSISLTILLALIFMMSRPNMGTYESLVGSKVFLLHPDDFIDGDNISMDDPRVVKKLFNRYLIPPPKSKLKHVYHLSNPRLNDTSMGQAEQIRNILQNKRNGFFIECGALDGETRSNTLYMERFLNWSGLLIEADPLNFSKMIRKNRKAWLSPSCLSKTPHPQVVSFKQEFNTGRISDKRAGSNQPGYVDVQCFPIYSYLLAMNVTDVDYFSLDIEGDELDVLKTLPFDKVNIETLSVEFAHVEDGKDKLREFMEAKGYKVVAEVTHPDWLANDFIFVKNS